MAADSPIIIDDGGSTTLRDVGGNLDKLLEDGQKQPVNRKLLSLTVVQVFNDIGESGATDGVKITTVPFARIGTNFVVKSKRHDVTVELDAATQFVTISLDEEGADVHVNRDTVKHYTIPNCGRITSITFQSGLAAIASPKRVSRTLVRLNFA